MLELHTAVMNENNKDQLWVKVTTLKNLKLAWIRTRNYLLHEDISDEIEVKLVDYAWEEYIQMLKAQPGHWQFFSIMFPSFN